MTPEIILLLEAAVFGLLMGSAITAIAYRVPRGVSWFKGRSACPHCGHMLGVLDLVPVFSWIASRGRCRYCRAPIPVRYPLTELVCAIWTVLAYLKLGLVPSLPLIAIWGYLLIGLFWIDLDYQLLPDVLTLPGTLIGLAGALMMPDGARHAIYGMLLGSGLLWALAWGYLRLRKIEGMGGGDIKLAAMLGAVLGWQLMLLTLLLASLAGSLWGVGLMLARRGDRMTALPFGTLLAPAALIAYLWGAGWILAYLRLIHRG